MKKILIAILSILTLGVVMSSCIEDEFTTSSSDVLTFSCDTLCFDTVVTLQGSATQQFVVYNKSKKQINISSIKVAGISDAKFYLNVDGTKGSEFHDIAIRGNDSIYIFVEGYLNENGENEPIQIFDRIDFETNGMEQHVTVSAWGQDVTRLKDFTVTRNTTMHAGKPYVIYDTLTVNPGVTLTIEPGAVLLFHDKAWMKVAGKLKAIGTPDKPIVMRGDRLDHVVGQYSFDIMSGQWDGIAIYGGSTGNEMQYVDMHSSTWGLQVGGADQSQVALHMLNCVLHNSAEYVLLTANAWVEAEGCEFSDARYGVVAFIGGKIRMTQCTFANYYLFSTIEGPNITWVIQDDEKLFSPLDCIIDNSISYGMGYDVNIGDNEGNNIYMRNCLLKSDGKDDAHFINCVWEGDPKFYTVREDYIFDYRLRNESDAIARGNRSYCPDKARYDRYGNDRFARTGLDLGAYVWIESHDEEQ